MGALVRGISGEGEEGKLKAYKTSELKMFRFTVFCH